MGTLYRAYCETCGYDETFALGSGMRAFDLSRNITTLNENEQAEILRIQQNNGISLFLAENQLVSCPHCMCMPLLQEKTIVRITDRHGNTFVFGDRCDCCGNKFTMYEERFIQNQEIIPCPRCTNRPLRFQACGFWD